MDKDKITKTQWCLLLLGILLAIGLAAALAVGTARAREEEARLEAERDRIEATRTEEVTTPHRHPSTMSGYELVAAKNKELLLYYVGDSAMWGRGMGGSLGVNAPCFRRMIREKLREKTGVLISGYVDEREPAPSLSRAAALFPMLREAPRYRLMILVPSSETAASGRAALAAEGFTGDFAHDLESLIRAVRTETPLCDILLAIPANVTDGEAAAIRAVGDYYGLVTADLRPYVTGEGLLHTEGDATGYPTEEGHAAYAEAIVGAILDAAERGHTTGALPEQRLY